MWSTEIDISQRWQVVNASWISMIGIFSGSSMTKQGQLIPSPVFWLFLSKCQWTWRPSGNVSEWSLAIWLTVMESRGLLTGLTTNRIRSPPGRKPGVCWGNAGSCSLGPPSPFLLCHPSPKRKDGESSVKSLSKLLKTSQPLPKGHKHWTWPFLNY